MKVVINIGLLLEAIRRRGLKGFSDASAFCQVSPKVFQKLCNGQLPRLDSLQRVCKALQLSERELIGGARSKPEEPGKVVAIKKVL